MMRFSLQPPLPRNNYAANTTVTARSFMVTQSIAFGESYNLVASALSSMAIVTKAISTKVLDSIIGVVSSTSSLTLRTKWAATKIEFATAKSSLIFKANDMSLEGGTGGPSSGGIDIYDGQCNLVKQDATSLTFAGDIVADNNSDCIEGVRVSYPAPSFSATFGITPSIVYRGRTVASVNLSWTYNPNNIGSQNLSGPGIPPQPGINDRSLSISGLSLVSNSSWNLSAIHANGSANKTASLVFCNDVKYFRLSSAIADATDIENEANRLDCNHLGDYSTDDTPDKPYWFLTFPNDYGTVTKILDISNLFNVPFNIQSGTVTVTNSEGFSEEYIVVRLLNETYSNINIRVS